MAVKFRALFARQVALPPQSAEISDIDTIDAGVLTYMRKALLLVALCCTAFSAIAQSNLPRGKAAFGPTPTSGNPVALSDAPRKAFLWRPDGDSVTYPLSSDSQHGQPNDVISVNARQRRSLRAGTRNSPGRHLWRKE